MSDWWKRKARQVTWQTPRLAFQGQVVDLAEGAEDATEANARSGLAAEIVGTLNILCLSRSAELVKKSGKHHKHQSMHTLSPEKPDQSVCPFMKNTFISLTLRSFFIPTPPLDFSSLICSL